MEHGTIHGARWGHKALADVCLDIHAPDAYALRAEEDAGEPIRHPGEAGDLAR
jgi:hypothetical protein